MVADGTVVAGNEVVARGAVVVTAGTVVVAATVVVGATTTGSAKPLTNAGTLCTAAWSMPEPGMYCRFAPMHSTPPTYVMPHSSFSQPVAMVARFVIPAATVGMYQRLLVAGY